MWEPSGKSIFGIRNQFKKHARDRGRLGSIKFHLQVGVFLDLVEKVNLARPALASRSANPGDAESSPLLGPFHSPHLERAAWQSLTGVGSGAATSPFFVWLAGSRHQLRAEPWCYAGRHGTRAAGASVMSWLLAAARRLPVGYRCGMSDREAEADGWAAAFGRFPARCTSRSLLPCLTTAVGHQPAFERLCWAEAWRAA